MRSFSAVAVEELAQRQRVGGLGQPEQRLPMELLRSLTGDAQGAADGGEGLRRRVGQPVVGDDDVGQAERKLNYQAPQGRQHLVLRNHYLHIAGRLGRPGVELLPGLALGFLHGPPHRSAHRAGRIGAERHPALRIVASGGPPQRQPSSLHGRRIAQHTQPLLAHHPVHQPLVFYQRLGGH